MWLTLPTMTFSIDWECKIIFFQEGDAEVFPNLLGLQKNQDLAKPKLILG